MLPGVQTVIAIRQKPKTTRGQPGKCPRHNLPGYNLHFPYYPGNILFYPDNICHMNTHAHHAAFESGRLIARGPLKTVLGAVLATQAAQQDKSILIFNEETGKQVDFDLRGTLEDVMQRIEPARTVGRPKLGVVSREVTLLPRHWTWLDQQKGGASATLRVLVETAMRQSATSVEGAAVDALYAQLSALAGDLPGFEEAARCLYKSDWNGFLQVIRPWPSNIGDYFATRLNEALGKASKQ